MPFREANSHPDQPATVSMLHNNASSTTPLNFAQCRQRASTPVRTRDIAVGIVTFGERHAGVELHLH
eukprot:384065-Prymnesium_polylepis.1